MFAAANIIDQRSRFAGPRTLQPGALPVVETSLFYASGSLLCWVIHGRDRRAPVRLLPCHQQRLRKIARGNGVFIALMAQAGKCSQLRTILDAFRAPRFLSHQVGVFFGDGSLFLACMAMFQAPPRYACCGNSILSNSQLRTMLIFPRPRWTPRRLVCSPAKTGSCLLVKFRGEKIRTRHRGTIPKSSQLRTFPTAAT